MSFLDNLENNLKALESREEGFDSGAARRDTERSRQRAAAPWAERLKNGEFSKRLMQEATRAGFALRTKVNMAWIGTTLRLDARGQRLELQPAPDGVMAVLYRDGAETARRPVDLDGAPGNLLRDWMATVADRKRQDEEAAAAAAVAEED